METQSLDVNTMSPIGRLSFSRLLSTQNIAFMDSKELLSQFLKDIKLEAQPSTITRVESVLALGKNEAVPQTLTGNDVIDLMILSGFNMDIADIYDREEEKIHKTVYTFYLSVLKITHNLEDAGQLRQKNSPDKFSSGAHSKFTAQTRKSAKNFKGAESRITEHAQSIGAPIDIAKNTIEIGINAHRIALQLNKRQREILWTILLKDIVIVQLLMKYPELLSADLAQ